MDGSIDDAERMPLNGSFPRPVQPDRRVPFVLGMAAGAFCLMLFSTPSSPSLTRSLPGADPTVHAALGPLPPLSESRTTPLRLPKTAGPILVTGGTRARRTQRGERERSADPARLAIVPVRASLASVGAGFVGFHLSQRLASEGFHVVVLDDFNPYYSSQLKRDRASQLTSKVQAGGNEAERGGEARGRRGRGSRRQHCRECAARSQTRALEVLQRPSPPVGADGVACASLVAFGFETMGWLLTVGG